MMKNLLVLVPCFLSLYSIRQATQGDGGRVDLPETTVNFFRVFATILITASIIATSRRPCAVHAMSWWQMQTGVDLRMRICNDNLSDRIAEVWLDRNSVSLNIARHR